MYFLFNPRTYDYYNYLVENAKPSAGLQLHLYYGSEEEAPLTTLLLAPGTHTLVSMVPEHHRTTARQLRTVPLYKAKLTCREKPEYNYVASGKSSKKYFEIFNPC